MNVLYKRQESLEIFLEIEENGIENLLMQCDSCFMDKEKKLENKDNEIDEIVDSIVTKSMGSEQ